MLFHSFEFIFVFLPTVWLGYRYLVARDFSIGATAWLVAASLIYYGYWNPRFIPLIAGSVLVNFWLGTKLADPSSDRRTRRHYILASGIAFNLLLLGYFKYTNFLIENINVPLGLEIQIVPIVLPIGISFFTFQQIAFLVDSFRREAGEYNLLRYSLFVTFFPQLIAGPIVHHSELIPQFGQQGRHNMASDLIVGLTIFVIGLFKKMIIADTMALGVDNTFGAAAAGADPTFFESWGAALCFNFQIYFDFSSYSDMAIGLGRMFGIRLPINFTSPYKADSIVDFWRRWHITLSRFLRDYLYIPLGGSRRGKARRYVNVVITMILGGIWHGAAWTFLLWGAMHGVFLLINLIWRERFPRRRSGNRWIGRVVTLLCVVVAWVPFRAGNFEAVLAMYRGMLGLNGVSVPWFASPILDQIPWFVTYLGVTANGMNLINLWIVAIGLQPLSLLPCFARTPRIGCAWLNRVWLRLDIR